MVWPITSGSAAIMLSPKSEPSMSERVAALPIMLAMEAPSLLPRPVESTMSLFRFHIQGALLDSG
ncbi:MAG: hypothetical protein A4S17_13640 [Proteobacteria bacterium HN_bin10]|nr:MAG: hypothetical protein A4S17_13640 [Proteobacteria bacterium HN_bin10]